MIRPIPAVSSGASNRKDEERAVIHEKLEWHRIKIFSSELKNRKYEENEYV